MKLSGRDIDARALLQAARARLATRGIRERESDQTPSPSRSPVDPLSFGVQALQQNVDPTLPPPVDESRASVSRSVALVRRFVRRTARPLIADLLGRQGVFNRQLLDLAAQLASEVKRMRVKVEALESSRTAKPRGTTKRAGRKGSPRR